MKDFVPGFFAPWIIYAVILLLHLLLPAEKVEGYVTDPATGKPLRYRLNGLLVLGVVVLLWVLLSWTGVIAWDWLWTHRWSGLIGSFVLGVLFSVGMVIPAPKTGRSLLADFYFGRWENPQWFGGRVDVKMYLYLIGAVLLALNVLSFTAHHVLTFASRSSPGVGLYCALFMWFIVDYLTFERVHLYTYDIFAERLGFKLGWGCFTFYPYFYAIGLWATADKPDPGIPVWGIVVPAVVFFAGWALSRGANMQKYVFKRHPDKAYLGFIKPLVITDGERSVLANGWWGVSRHVNYLGEILMALALALAPWYLGVWEVWLYPAFYVFLLFPRQWADDRRCAAKYGPLWAEYRRRVPSRIIPKVY